MREGRVQAEAAAAFTHHLPKERAATISTASDGPGVSRGFHGVSWVSASWEEDGGVGGQPGITFELLDGTQAAAHADELRALHAEVYGRDDDGSFAGRFRVLRRQPGFVLAEARHGGYLVGYACGMPLRPSTSWWRHLTAPLPDEVTTEHPGRTFALVELLVRASWRRQGMLRPCTT